MSFQPQPMIEATPGEMVYDTAKRAVKAARTTGRTHRLVHNGIDVAVYPQSCNEDIVEKWFIKQELHVQSTERLRGF